MTEIPDDVFDAMLNESPEIHADLIDRQCFAVRRSGDRCKRCRDAGSIFCWQHRRTRLQPTRFADA